MTDGPTDLQREIELMKNGDVHLNISDVEGVNDLWAALNESLQVAHGGAGQVYVSAARIEISSGDGYVVGDLLYDAEFFTFHPTDERKS